jgi:hypothetical protein
MCIASNNKIFGFQKLQAHTRVCVYDAHFAGCQWKWKQIFAQMKMKIFLSSSSSRPFFSSALPKMCVFSVCEYEIFRVFRSIFELENDFSDANIFMQIAKFE